VKRAPSSKTIQILSLIAQNHSLSQREMAKKTGLSLGLVNLILKRLIETGHIKISAMNKKKVAYGLTPRGFMEKASHSYDYLCRTISVFMAYKERVDSIVRDLAAQGHRRFAILGEGEVSQLVEYSLGSHSPSLSCRHIQSADMLDDHELLVDCRLTGKTISPTGIQMLARLLESSS
jgi:DNA-binding MarR family transcriptional regulator